MLLAGTGGLVLGLVAEWWGRTPAGNTALVVPFAGGPALLAGVWVLLALGVRQREASWRRLAAGAGLSALTALVTSLLAIFTPVLLTARGAADQGTVVWLALVPPLALAVVAGGLLAALLGHPLTGPGWVVSGGAAALAVVGLWALPGVAYLAGALFLPLLVALPVAAGRTRTPGPATSWAGLGLAFLALPLVLIAGLRLGGALVAGGVLLAG